LCRKNESKASGFEELFQLFDVVDGQIPKDALKKYITLLNPWGMIQKGDVAMLANFMDVDGDGIISANDFLESRTKSVDIQHKF
jgi:Ca2+-binding EF-hand superfamily protein